MWILSVYALTLERNGESVNMNDKRNSVLKCWCDKPFDIDDQAERNVGKKENHGRSQRYVFAALFCWWLVTWYFDAKSCLGVSNKLSLGLWSVTIYVSFDVILMPKAGELLGVWAVV